VASDQACGVASGGYGDVSTSRVPVKITKSRAAAAAGRGSKGSISYHGGCIAARCGGRAISFSSVQQQPAVRGVFPALVQRGHRSVAVTQWKGSTWKGSTWKGRHAKALFKPPRMTLLRSDE
jgi:hypothetical protein